MICPHDYDCDLVELVNSESWEDQLMGTEGFRKFLSINSDPPIDLVIETGLVPRFIEFLTADQDSLQLEAAWVLTNLCSGSSNQTAAVVKSGVIPALTALLIDGEKDQLIEQSLWGLSNIIGDTDHHRDLVIQSGFLPLLLQILHQTQSLPVVRCAVWAISNIFRLETTHVGIDVASACTRALVQVLSGMHQNDIEVLTSSCWAFVYLTRINDDQFIQAAIDVGAHQILVNLLAIDEVAVVLPALRALGNISAGTAEQTGVSRGKCEIFCHISGPFQEILKSDLLPRLHHLLQHSNVRLVRDTCWTLSNILAGTKTQIQAVFDQKILPDLIAKLSDANPKVKIEAAWAVSNAAFDGAERNAMEVAVLGAAAPLCDVLPRLDGRGTDAVLNALDRLLTVGPKSLADELFSAGKLSVILACPKRHDNMAVIQKCRLIETKFFDSNRLRDRDCFEDSDIISLTFN